MSGPVVQIDYTNYKGVRSIRRIRVVRFYYGRTEFHPEPGYLLEADDLDKGQRRTFAMRDVHSWTEEPDPPLWLSDVDSGD